MATVTIVNKTKKPARMLILNLTKQIAPRKVSNRTIEEGRDGSRRIRVIEKIVPDSIRIPAKGSIRKLDEKILSCPEIAAAIERREIAVIKETTAPVARKSGQGEATAKPKQRRKRG